MSDFSDISAGVKVVLETANPALRVYTEPPPSILEYPCIIVEPVIESVRYGLDLADNTWAFTMPLTLTLRHGSAQEGWQELKKYLSPTGTESIFAGIATDATLNNTVDFAILGPLGGEGDPVRNVGRDPEDDGGQQVYGATFLLTVCETL